MKFFYKYECKEYHERRVNERDRSHKYDGFRKLKTFFSAYVQIRIYMGDSIEHKMRSEPEYECKNGILYAVSNNRAGRRMDGEKHNFCILKLKT